MARWAEREQRRERENNRAFREFLRDRVMIEVGIAAVCVSVLAGVAAGAGLAFAVARFLPGVSPWTAAFLIAAAVACLAGTLGRLARFRDGAWARRLVFSAFGALGGFALGILLRTN